MNKSTSIASIIICLTVVTCLFAFKSNTKGSETIIIRTIQINTNYSHIGVFKGNGEVEKIDLKPWRTQNEEANYSTIITTVRKYEDMGHVLISSSEGLATTAASNTLFLPKDKIIDQFSLVGN